MKSNLLASAPSLDGILESIARFYCGSTKTLEPEPGKVDRWLVVGLNESPCLGVRVVKRRNRYRFEMI